MRLSNEQSDYLRILGHELKPVVEVGAGGVTPSLVRQIDEALNDQELVKVRVPFGDKVRRSRVLEELAPLAQAHLVQRVGTTALLYRPAREPGITLPPAP